MRICFLVNQLAAWSKIGGFGTNTRRLARALAAAGVEVHAAIPKRNGPSGTETLDGIVVHGLSDWEVYFGSSIYREIDADIYHSEEPSMCTYWAQKALPDRVHLVTSMDPRDRTDWRIELNNATWSRRLKFPLQYLYEAGPLVTQAVRRTQGVYVEAEFLTEKTAKLYGLPVPPGILPKPIEIPPGPFVKSAKPLCVFVGRFDPRKRPEAFFELARQLPEIEFIAVGRAHDASYQRALEPYFNLPNLTVTGFVDPFKSDTLAHILSRAWVLVHPAAREGLPTAFQEASAHEVAILAHVDPAGYVSQFGRHVPAAKGLEGLGAALCNLIEDDEWRRRGRAGRRYNIEHHALDYSIACHLEVYRKHLGAASAWSTMDPLPA